MSGQIDIEAGVRDCVQKLAIGAEATPDETLLELDSLGLVELVVVLEEHFDIEIPDLMLNDQAFESIRALNRLVAACRAPSTR